MMAPYTVGSAKKGLDGVHVLVLGSTGQVGSALVKKLRDHGASVTAWSREQIPNYDLQQLQTELEALEVLSPVSDSPSSHSSPRSTRALPPLGVPSVIINAAAYTQVDQAETDTESATRVNAELPRLLAEHAKKIHAVLIHYSTDYVYAGEGTKPHQESDSTAPLNHYGRSKLRGDQVIEQIAPRYLILRTSWVYSATGKNFFNTMLKFGQERSQLKVVNDQVGSPTYAPDLAELTLLALARALEQEAVCKKFPSGIYHLCNAGTTTWHQFASQIFDLAREHHIPLQLQHLEAIPTSSYPTPARRPLNSRLSLKKLEGQFGIQPRPWTEALRECFEVWYRQTSS
jgi:dTDP-4-dehydrorhamnose reductase